MVCWVFGVVLLLLGGCGVYELCRLVWVFVGDNGVPGISILDGLV